MTELSDDPLSGKHYVSKRSRRQNGIRAFRNPCIFDERVTIKGYPDPICQIAVTNIGHEKPILLVTNQLDQAPTRLVERYARRILIENAIAFDLFHVEALSAAVPLKIDVDLQFTVMGTTLYRLLARQIGRGHQRQAPKTLFRKLVHAIVIEEKEITVKFGRRANNP